MSSQNYTLKLAYDDLNSIRELFKEYTDALGIDLSFQHFDAEMQSLPGKYALPKGRLYVLYFDGKLAGCAALRPLNASSCEFKRLYVRPAFRGQHLGKLLLNQLKTAARELGYLDAYFDTLPTLTAAVQMYETMGCEKIPAYYPVTRTDLAFYHLALS